MKALFQSPLFLLGFLLRAGLILTISPTPVLEWYVPFLNASIAAAHIDPWSTWISQGGAAGAFPYGYAMWAIFLLPTLVCKLMGLSLVYGYGLTLLAADFGIFLILRQLVANRQKIILITYWLSPIVIAACYFLGFNDVIPAFFLVLSLYFLKDFRLSLSGFVLITSISAKFSMVLAFPFFAIYLLHNRSLRQFSAQFYHGLTIGFLVLIFPFLFSEAGLRMLVGNPEMGKVYRLTLDFGDGLRIYIVPLIYILLLYAAWRVRRLNFELLNVLLGMAFLLVILMTPASPGWFIWALPFLVTYQATGDRAAVALTALFSALYVIGTLLFISMDWGPLRWLQTFFASSTSGGANIPSLIQTMMVAVGIILALRIWRESVNRNDYFRLSRQPFVVGIAGDSGAGKDTVSDSIASVFGNHSVAKLSGDDYHLWDRQKPMWQVMTHLNPMANDIERFTSDLIALRDGRTILTRHYDHTTGKMSRPHKVKSNDIIIASGLHALYLPILRDCYSLSIYLDMDEGLRRHFKIQRDIKHRGQSIAQVMTSFERREPDSVRFIRPQASYADLILSLQPINPQFDNDQPSGRPLRMKLVARSRHGLNELSLTRVLVGVCGLHVDVLSSNDASEVEVTIEGDTSSEDIELAARMLCPRIFEFLDMNPVWQDGMIGLMQLIVLSHVDQALMKRFI